MRKRCVNRPGAGGGRAGAEQIAAERRDVRRAAARIEARAERLADAIVAERLAESEATRAADGVADAETQFRYVALERDGAPWPYPHPRISSGSASFLADGALRVPIQRAYPLEKAGEALQALPTTHTQGKLGITIT